MSTKHLTYLDSLRGLAALTVVFSHYVQFFRMNQFTHTGRIAVCLFFILSGFVLAQRFLGAADMKWSIIAAVIKRPFRLLGVVWATIILGVLINIFVQGITPDQLGKSWTQFAVDFFVSPFATGEIYNSVLWTIHWELWGSMIVFGSVFLCGAWPKYLRLAVFGAVLFVNIRNFYCAFMIGVIIAELHKSFYCSLLIKYRNLLAVPMLAAGVALGVAYLAPDSDPVMSACFSNGFRMISAVAIFIAVMLNTTFMRSMLQWRPVNFLGNISYSLYAIHCLIMKTIAETVDTMLNQYLQHDVAFCGTILITLPIIIFAAWIMDKYVDKPSIKFASWFEKKLTGEIRRRTELVRSITIAAFRNAKALISKVFNALDPDIEP